MVTNSILATTVRQTFSGETTRDAYQVQQRTFAGDTVCRLLRLKIYARSLGATLYASDCSIIDMQNSQKKEIPPTNFAAH